MLRVASVLTLLAAVPAAAAPLTLPRDTTISPWSDAPPLLQVLPSPCPGPNCEMDLAQPNALGRRIVYLNFEGQSLSPSNVADDARTNTSAIVNGSKSVPRFELSALSDGNSLVNNGWTREEVIEATVAQLEETFDAFDVNFTTTRPTTGNYHMIVFAGSGSTCENTTGASGCAGIALRDCGDVMANNIVFVFTWGIRGADMAQVAAHEGGHAFGLDHVDNNDEIMYYSVQNHVTTEFSEGPIYAPDRPDACFGETYQDSVERLMNAIGPRGQDVLAPELRIVSPQNGATVVPGTPIVATATDLDSSVAKLELKIDGTVVASKTTGPFEFTLPDRAPGPVTLRIEATDVGNNTSAAQVAVTVAGDIPCSGPEDCPEGLRCGDADLCVPGDVPGSLGSPCATNDECTSGLCGNVDGESRCTQACDEATPCPGGFECLGDTACWPADGGGGGGCSAADPGQSPTWWLLALAAALGLVRRRQLR